MIINIRSKYMLLYFYYLYFIILQTLIKEYLYEYNNLRLTICVSFFYLTDMKLRCPGSTKSKFTMCISIIMDMCMKGMDIRYKYKMKLSCFGILL